MVWLYPEGALSQPHALLASNARTLVLWNAIAILKGHGYNKGTVSCTTVYPVGSQQTRTSRIVPSLGLVSIGIQRGSSCDEYIVAVVCDRAGSA